ncbi:MAG: SPOR domain-containing protein [Treponema sp.]|jgi:cell division septation protein DedD|nr:SPOR domain-containing protein [Treponema sp.]
MKKAAIVLILSALIVPPAAAQVIEGNGTWYSTTEETLSASHANLPFDTRVRITNPDNNQSVIATITGRIPEDPERLIDVSRAAARNIGMKDSGTTRVKVEVLTLGRAPDDEESPVFPEKPDVAEILPPPESGVEKTATPVPELLPELPADIIVDVPGSPGPETAGEPEPSPVPEKTENRAEAAPAVVVEPPVVNIPPAQYQLSITIEGLGAIERSGVLESGKETTIRVQAPGTVSKALPPSPPPPPAVVPVPPPPVRPPAAAVPRMPLAYDGRLYRIQVGSFSSVAAAVRARDRVINAGFNAYYERHEEMYRIVLIHIPSADIPRIAEKLGNAGFRELWIRVE